MALPRLRVRRRSIRKLKIAKEGSRGLRVYECTTYNFSALLTLVLFDLVADVVSATAGTAAAIVVHDHDDNTMAVCLVVFLLLIVFLLVFRASSWYSHYSLSSGGCCGCCRCNCLLCRCRRRQYGGGDA